MLDIVVAFATDYNIRDMWQKVLQYKKKGKNELSSEKNHPTSKESLIYSFKKCQRARQCYSDSKWLSHRCVILVLVESTLLIVKRRSFPKLGLIQVS